ncbi:hypothetical protein I3F58_18080 [Streptomyces sp. MUM 203J]|uniref:hypothetical protein n=1 Tax=Streptomyces sp. MUM 203J TaxID=2791990 RepID=UPI001F03A8FB|nr:hypothetical protein [Streptomyces sp. MUM 203J]MCH0541433.1 hypothetical protein [Streptomyces sp. MUM 203J]
MTGTLLRLRGDAYYVPVPNGVWIRTTDGSFTLKGGTVATWVERLAPLLDRGIEPGELLAALKPEQAAFVDTLLKTLEQRKVLRWEHAEGGFDEPSARLFPQQAEFLRHFTPHPAAAFDRVRRHPLAVAGPVDRAAPLATALIESGFGDIMLLDTEPDADLRELADEFTRQGAPVHLRGPDADADAGRTLTGIFPPGDEQEAWRFLDRSEHLGCGAWAGLVRGQAMLLKGQMPRSGHACVRCAWRRLAHRAVALPPSEGLGHVPVSVAATVIAQELFQYTGAGERSVLGEGVVVDLTRLSVWRTAVDPDPGCPGYAVHAGPADAADPSIPAPERRRARFPESVFGARCFGPLFSCAPERLPQFPLTALHVRINPPGRAAPTGTADGPVVVAESVAEARAEAALTAVEASLATGAEAGAVAGVGRDSAQALARAVLRWADVALDGAASGTAGAERSERARNLAELAGADVDVTTERHPSGLWRARVDTTAATTTRTGFDPGQAEERALTAALALRQLGQDDDVRAVPAWTGPVPARRHTGDLATALGLTWREAVLPALVAADLSGIFLTPGHGA